MKNLDGYYTGNTSRRIYREPIDAESMRDTFAGACVVSFTSPCENLKRGERIFYAASAPYNGGIELRMPACVSLDYAFAHTRGLTLSPDGMDISSLESADGIFADAPDILESSGARYFVNALPSWRGRWVASLDDIPRISGWGASSPERLLFSAAACVQKGWAAAVGWGGNTSPALQYPDTTRKNKPGHAVLRFMPSRDGLFGLNVRVHSAGVAISAQDSVADIAEKINAATRSSGLDVFVNVRDSLTLDIYNYSATFQDFNITTSYGLKRFDPSDLYNFDPEIMGYTIS